ncbi:MAG: hypothetical protein NTZ74_05685 [Chloroflexi bacterium]|nr:hypothetical protein [Chloroflexota bacterium]
MKKILACLVSTLLFGSLLACSISVNLTPTPEPLQILPTSTTIVPPTVAPTLPIASTVSPEQTITVYFTNEARFSIGTEPYEDAVIRPLPDGADPMPAVLDAFFAGPNPQEIAQGLILVSSGFTGVRLFKVENGIAHIYLAGTCANNGAAYSVASLIGKNLSQFPEITAIKIYDENDSNLDPLSSTSSLPYCLEP